MKILLLGEFSGLHWNLGKGFGHWGTMSVLLLMVVVGGTIRVI